MDMNSDRIFTACNVLEAARISLEKAGAKAAVKALDEAIKVAREDLQRALEKERAAGDGASRLNLA